MEEVKIGKESKFVEHTLDECGIGRDLGIIVVAIKKTDGTMMLNPSAKTTINEGDILIALGEITMLQSLEQFAKSPAS